METMPFVLMRDSENVYLFNVKSKKGLAILNDARTKAFTNQMHN